MRCRVIALTVAAGLVVASCGGGEPNATTPDVTTTTNSPTTTVPATPTTTTTMPIEELREAITVDNDVEYATFDGVPLTLDLYLPADSLGAPVVITEGFEEIEGLVEEGMIVVNVDDFVPPIPPLGPDQPLVDNRVPFRGGAEAFGCAIRFVRERALELGTDDPTVALMSLSAGGGYVAHVALFGAELEAAWDGFAAAGGPPRQVECAATNGSTDVHGLIGVAGAYDFFVPVFEGRYGLRYQVEQDPELQEFLASAVGTNRNLKVRLFHDPADSVIPLENSTMFEAVLAEAGYDVEIITFDGGHSYPKVELIVPALMEVLGR